MGLRFRKSINLGGGFRVNLSKSGVGYSWGVKGARITRTAKGKTRVTASIPGTGLSYSEEIGGKKRKSAVHECEDAHHQEKEGRGQMYWGKFIVCLLFGWLGVHKFMEKKKGMGFLYLFTIGLFGIGWLVDIVRYFCAALRHGKIFGKITAGVLAALVVLGLIAGGSDKLPEEQDVIRQSALPAVTVEATATVLLTEEPTATAEPVATPTAAPTATAEPAETSTPVPTATDKPVETPTAAPTQDVSGFVLKRGDKNEDVRNLQLMLIGLGYLNGNADGDYGAKTEQAVLAYQKVAGLTASGECDDATYSHIQSDKAVPAPTEKITAKPTQKVTEKPAQTVKPTEKPTEKPGRDYVLNTNTRKFHKPSCSSADDIKASNRAEFHGTREEVISKGYDPCKRCNP